MKFCYFALFLVGMSLFAAPSEGFDLWDKITGIYYKLKGGFNKITGYFQKVETLVVKHGGELAKKAEGFIKMAKGAYEQIGPFVEKAQVKSREYLTKANAAYESVAGTVLKLEEFINNANPKTEIGKKVIKRCQEILTKLKLKAIKIRSRVEETSIALGILPAVAEVAAVAA